MKETYYNNEDLIFVKKKRFNIKNGRLVETFGHI